MTIKSKLFNKTDIIAILVIILSSIIFLTDTLLFKNQPANMDGTIHITNIAIFHQAMSDGDFPVRWTDGFANYGLPMGSFAQQLTSYLGALLTFFTNNVVVSFNIVYIIGTLLSVLLFYIFLRFHFKTWPSFLGAFLFNFAPYRIINLYIRGAIPEYFSSVFLVAILIFLYLLFKKKTVWSYLGLSLSIFGMILCHPMNMLTGSFFIGPYLIYLLSKEKNKLNSLLLVLSSMFLGVLLSSYYLLPLLKDIQYFYYGSSTNHYTAGFALNLKNFTDPKWYYFLPNRNEILSRGHFIKTGLIEFLLLIVSLVVFISNRIKKLKINLFDLAVLIGIICLLLTTKLAEPIYQSVDFLSNMQFPWRMLSTFIFIPPIILAYLMSKFPKKLWSIILGLLLIAIISWNRFAEVYGKNFTVFPQDHYYFTIDNLHTSNMNTIWTAKTTDYPVHQQDKVAILEGQASLSDIVIKNSKRTYKISAADNVRMIDYTFYYPGWKVFSDGKEVPIEFQDINNKGVITYWLPAGNHEVEVVFTQTKTVLFANLLTIFGLIIIFLVVTMKKRINKLSVKVECLKTLLFR